METKMVSHNNALVDHDQKHSQESSLKFLIATIFTVIVLSALVLEILSSIILIHYYRLTGFINDGPFQSSTLNGINKALVRFGWVEQAAPFEFKKVSEPD